VETAIVDPTTVIPTTPTPITQASPPIIAPKIYGEALTFTAQLRVANIPACANDPTAVACTWIGQPITPTLTGMPALGPLNISVAFPGQPTPPEALTKEIDAGGNAAFSFTHLNADANQNANFTFLPTFNNLSQAPNFGGSTATSQYTITPRPLTVTANALSWEYGSPPMKPAPLANEVLVTGTFTDDQVQYGENVTPSYSTTQNAMTEVGSYTDALVADVIFGAGVRAANYAVSKTNATLTVTKAPLTVTAASPSRLYGDPNPALTGTVVGIKNNDAYTATYTTLATASSSVAGSPYAITAAITGDRLPRNYNITLNPGQLTVNSRPLTVNVVAPAHVPYGSPFTLGTTNNAVLADGFTISFTGAPASVPAPVGSYTIGATVTGANVTGPKPNYAPVTVNTATMIVDPPPTATPDLQFKFTEQTSVDDVLFDRYNFTVTNRASFPASLFEPRAGATTCISKTRVDFFDAETNQYIYGFCGLGSPDNLDNIWFAVPRWTQPPAGVYLKFIDQTTNAVLFTSNTVQLFGPLFTNFPRTVALDWAPIAGAASYTVQVDYCESWASPDWRSCNAWLPRQTLTVAAPATSVSHTFLGDQPGRWRVTAVSVTGAPLGTTEYKYFNYRTAP
jgi:hypothetical protein